MPVLCKHVWTCAHDFLACLVACSVLRHSYADRKWNQITATTPVACCHAMSFRWDIATLHIEKQINIVPEMIAIKCIAYPIVSYRIFVCLKLDPNVEDHASTTQQLVLTNNFILHTCFTVSDKSSIEQLHDRELGTPHALTSSWTLYRRSFTAPRCESLLMFLCNNLPIYIKFKAIDFVHC